MKKIVLSGFVIFTFVGYGLYQKSQNGSVSVGIPTTQPTSKNSSIPPAASNQLTYKNGSYTGSVADAYYGNVQVKAVIANGKISDVQFLQYPNDRSTSQMINSQAMPLLTQEAIQVQSAQVDGVSGATQTSRAFIQSLSNALSQAK
jgi:uncharacterized protein with FMN-binding domain